MRQTDESIHAKLDGPLKKARESMLGKMLTEDVFGKETVPKKYEELTTQELNTLVEGVSIRLNLFKREYPTFMPHVVKAIMEHPNLANSDRHTMETYCNVFELDWRGDKTLENREKFLMERPVYLDGKDDSSLRDHVDREWLISKLR